MAHEILGHKQTVHHIPAEPTIYPMVEWFVRNQKNIYIAVVVIGLGISLSIWRMSARTSQAAFDVVRANMLADELAKSSSNSSTESDGVENGMTAATSEEAVSELKAIDDQYPVLQHRYDGIIAQELILENKSDQIDPYATRAVRDLREIGIDKFAAFSEVSRLAALGQNEQALEKASLLLTALAAPTDEEISEQIQKHEFALHAFTLLETATLQKKLGKKEEMHKTVATLGSLLGVSPDATLSPEHKAAASSVRSLLEEQQGKILDTFN